MRLRVPAAVRRRGGRPERPIVLTDDFGASVRMSAAQFGDLVAQARSGALDSVL